MVARRILSLVGAFGASLAIAAAVAGSAAGASATGASCRIAGGSGSTIGWARFGEDATCLVPVNVHVERLTAALHGIHIHSVAACTPTFAAASGHYNPFGVQHGLA